MKSYVIYCTFHEHLIITNVIDDIYLLHLWNYSQKNQNSFYKMC